MRRGAQRQDHRQPDPGIPTRPRRGGRTSRCRCRCGGYPAEDHGHNAGWL